MATPTLAKSPESHPGYDGNLIDNLIREVEQVQKPKPPQPTPAPQFSTYSPDSSCLPPSATLSFSACISQRRWSPGCTDEESGRMREYDGIRSLRSQGGLKTVNQLIGKDEDGSPVLVLVLEPANIHRIVTEALPIDLRVESMFPAGIPRKLRLVIAHSYTSVADAKQFSAMADVALDERTPVAQEKRPHCPQCRSTIEQLGVWRNESPLALLFCVGCGCTLGSVPNEIAKGLKP